MNAINLLFEQVEIRPLSMINALNINKLVVVSSSLQNYNEYYLDKCHVVSLNRYPNLDNYEFIYNFELINLLKDEKLQLYKIIDRYFASISPNKTKFKSISRFYLKLIHYSLEIIEHNNIDTLFTWDMPHSPFNYALFIISKLKRIKIIGSKFIHSDNYDKEQIRFISEDFPRLDKHFFLNYQNLLHNNVRIGIKDLSKQSIQIYNKYLYLNKGNYSPNYGDKWTFINAISSIIRRNRNIIFNPTIILKLPKFIPYLKTFTIDKIHKTILVDYVKKNSIDIDKFYDSSFQFLFFPLHFQPEMTTVPLGREFDDQLLIIDMISGMLPDKMYLIVKEHPSYIKRLSSNEGIYLSRSKNYYNKIINNNKVKFIGFNGDSLSLIKMSSAVVTVSGTAAFEALAFNKPAITFGDSTVNDLPNTFEVKSKEDLMNAITSINSGDLDFKKQYIYFLKALESITVPINVEKLKDKSLVDNELSAFFMGLCKLDIFKKSYE